MTDLDTLATELSNGNRRALSRAITLAESTRDDHRQQAAELLAKLHGQGQALRIGITGVPGVGKSTFIEGLGLHLIEQGHKVAVLAVDPSSTLRGGAILGDKTRMQSLTQRSEAFIRPSPSGTTLGGVARRTFDAALLCEAAGYDIILIETVGVGQSETTVASMTDVFMLLLLPGGGDDLQGIKRGIMEVADLILVNKADGDSAKLANHTVADYRAALQFLPQKRPYWRCKIQAMSALTQSESIAEAWQSVMKVINAAKEADDFDAFRSRQAVAALWRDVHQGIEHWLQSDPTLKAQMQQLQNEVSAHTLAPAAAAETFLNLLKKDAK